jgi:voltage-gated potassium channel
VETEAQAQAEPNEPPSFGTILRATLRVVAILALLLVGYALLPGTEETSWGRILTFSIVLVARVVLMVYETRSILRSRYPAMRAVEGLVTVLGLFLVVFSVVYLSMSHASGQTFNTPLDHVRALYFTVVVFGTVGFGDIVAKTDGARLVVTVQILLDLLLIGLFVRLVLGAVQKWRGGQ